MNKANKHIQSGILTSPNAASDILATPVRALSSNSINDASNNSAALSTPGIAQKNVMNSIMSILPDNRPITSLQIVEEYEKCPRNFTPVHRTYDQDSDADLWRENNILFGRQTTRYLCLSKTEGLPEYVVETLKVIAEKIQPPKEFSLLSRTADTEQKAWRKRQIAYKLSKRGTVTHAVTDIILCSKLKIAPEGFKLAGDINGVLVCYKTGAIHIRPPPPVPASMAAVTSVTQNGNCSEAEKALNRLNMNANINNNSNRNSGNWNPNQPLPPVPKDDHDYEEIQTSSPFQVTTPLRRAPRPPPVVAKAGLGHSIGTLGAYSELDGVPFIINPLLKRDISFVIPKLPTLLDKEFEYDFQLERQVLCTMKSPASKNPFFK